MWFQKLRTMQKKEPLQLSNREKEIIQGLLRRGMVRNGMGKRLQVLLLASEGMSNYVINHRLGMQKNRIGIWRDRWEKHSEKLRKLELDKGLNLSDKDIEKHILEIMADEKRASKPSKISLAQMNQMVAIACEKPQNHGIPISKWSYEVLAQVIVEKNIVESISPSYVWKILAKKNCNLIR